jgi:endoglucanase
MSFKKITVAILFSSVFAGIALAATAPSATPVRLNSVGFIPHFPKKVTIKVPDSVIDTVGTAFSVKRASDNSVAFEGRTEPWAFNGATDERLWIADFTLLRDTGAFYVDVPILGAAGRSARFRIADDVYVEAYRVMMLGMYLWRCGPAVISASYNGQTYSHAACHKSDGIIHSSGQRKDGTGGWHDAGDYNKYVVNSGITVGMMLKAWEHFTPLVKNIDLIAVTQSGSIPKFLTEVKYNLDWVAKMQFDDSTVSHKLTTQKFGKMILPENETDTRYFTPYSTAATASFVAQMAMAYRIYKTLDPEFSRTCGNMAVKSYNYLANHPGNVSMTGQGTTFVTGAYDASDASYRLWAAAEMWEATGQRKYLEDFETRAKGSLITEYFDWSNVSNLGAITYLLSDSAGRNQELVETIRDNVITAANSIANNANNNKHGRTFGAYYWGANGIVARNVLLLHTAYKLTGDPKYAYAAQDAVSYLLGRNYYGRSFVTGIGNQPPQSPHDRTSVAQGKPWPGRLIGGPHSKSNANDAPESLKCALDEVCWFDSSEDYWTNEVAINWNSAMIYALASLLPESDFQNAPAAPDPSAVRSAARSKKAHVPGVKITRAVKTRGGKLDIPPNAKVYGLNGRLIARRRADSAKIPEIKRNGVFIIKTEK